MAATTEVRALLESPSGDYNWSVSSLGQITIYNATMRPLGQLDFEGKPTWAAAGGGLRKVRFSSIEDAGNYFSGLFGK